MGAGEVRGLDLWRDRPGAGGKIVTPDMTSPLAPLSDIVYGGNQMKVVMDTDVLVSAFISARGASRQLLIDVLDEKRVLLLSTPLLLQYESVLTRTEHLDKARATHADVTEILDALAGLCQPVVFDYHWRPTGADPDDELVVETAVNGSADMLVTFNIRHMRAAGVRFGFAVGFPGPLVRKIRT